MRSALLVVHLRRVTAATRRPNNCRRHVVVSIADDSSWLRFTVCFDCIFG